MSTNSMKLKKRKIEVDLSQEVSLNPNKILDLVDIILYPDTYEVDSRDVDVAWTDFRSIMDKFDVIESPEDLFEFDKLVGEKYRVYGPHKVEKNVFLGMLKSYYDHFNKGENFGKYSHFKFATIWDELIKWKATHEFVEPGHLDIDRKYYGKLIFHEHINLARPLSNIGYRCVFHFNKGVSHVPIGENSTFVINGSVDNFEIIDKKEMKYGSTYIVDNKDIYSEISGVLGRTVDKSYAGNVVNKLVYRVDGKTSDSKLKTWSRKKKKSPKRIKEKNKMRGWNPDRF